jgi:aspartate aminotransferase
LRLSASSIQLTAQILISLLLPAKMGSLQNPTSSVFETARYIPPDAIFEVTKNYLADTDAKKVNLGQGTYRDENGKPWVLPSVRMAKELITNCGHEYLPISGLKTFREEAVKLVFNGTKPFSEDRVRLASSAETTC